MKELPVTNRRKYERYHVGNFPVNVKKPDGTILKAILNDISYRGFQIACTGLTARMLSRKTGVLANDDNNEVEILIKIQSKEKIQEIDAVCRLVYIAKDEAAQGENSFIVGLEVRKFKGESLDVIKQLVRKINA